MSGLGTGRGTEVIEANSAPSVEADKALTINDLSDSRGGTRTRDPGIMSAVL